MALLHLFLCTPLNLVFTDFNQGNKSRALWLTCFPRRRGGGSLTRHERELGIIMFLNLQLHAQNHGSFCLLLAATKQTVMMRPWEITCKTETRRLQLQAEELLACLDGNLHLIIIIIETLFFQALAPICSHPEDTYTYFSYF